MGKLLIGILIGAIGLGLTMVSMMPKMMLHERVSLHNHDKTVELITTAARKADWKVSHTMDIQQNLAKHGEEVSRVTVLKLCQPQHASTILRDDNAMFVSVMMPCSIAVYDKSDGRTFVSTMNTELMGRLFGGTVAEVMAGPVARETAAITDFLD